MSTHWPEVVKNEESWAKPNMLDWAHPRKTEQQYYQACSEVEPTGKEEPRSYQEWLEEIFGRRGGSKQATFGGSLRGLPKTERESGRIPWICAPQGVEGNK